MKKMIAAVLVVCAVTPFVCAADNDDPGQLGVSFDLTYLSRWMSKGVPAYGKQSAWFETVDIDWFGTGFGTQVTHRSAGAAGYVDKQRFDYRPYYKFKLFEDERYQINANISTGYENYYGTYTSRWSTWETICAFSFPNAIGGGFTPSYIIHYETQAGPDYDNSGWCGYVHRFKLDYDFKLEELPDLPLKFSSEVGYYDGMDNRPHDWGYATFGLSSSIKLCDNTKIVPGIFHQVSMDEAVCNEKDVTYAKVSFKIDF